MIEAGITEDYSMGFPYVPGFRAGTCKPFYFYDLKKESSKQLENISDNTNGRQFYGSRNIQLQDFLEDIFNLINEVKNVNGTFMSIWHNHTVSETNEYGLAGKFMIK